MSKQIPESSENGVTVVKALFTFTGKNNDELNFKKGDTIIITQKEDGGWWEGTLDDNTGWFPSNYVREIGPTESFEQQSGREIESPPLSPQQSQTQLAYRNMVAKEIIESERSHVAELKNVHVNYLCPLKTSNILSESEYFQLIGNFEDIISTHSSLLSHLEAESENMGKDQKIGGIFLKMAPSLQSAHKMYISNHPKAVCVIEKYKEALNCYLENLGCPTPGTLALTTFLSSPFRRLDKYPALMQEAHRHTEDDHSDRGDTQRSAHVYRDLTTACSSIRRQKQLELEVITNKVHGWEGGETLSVLGDVLHMRSVALLPDNRDRYLVLFKNCLLVLALSPRASSFIFEGKYLLSDLTVNHLDDANNLKNAFEITGGFMDRIVAVCQSRSDQQQWVEVLNQQINSCLSTLNQSPPVHKPSHPLPPVPPAHGSPLYSSHLSSQSSNSSRSNIKPWSLNCLRPSPPLRPALTLKDDKKSTKYGRKKDDKWHEEDALILRVIEAYCTSAKSRYTVNSSIVENPPVLIAAQEKIIVEEKKGSEVVHEERSLIDTVYNLKDQLTSLVQSYHSLKQDFETERKATQKLRNLVQKKLLIDDLSLDGD